MNIWHYKHPDGLYIVNLDDNTFIQEPKGNKLTVAQVQQHSSDNQVIPTRQSLTRNAVIDLIVEEYTSRNHIDVIPN